MNSPTHPRDRWLLTGNEAIARAALSAQIALGTGYPGTPSTEILETLSAMGGRAQWAPNEKVALDVGLGVALAGARSLVTMKHVGVNVAADTLFTAAYTGTRGALVLVSADDPGMASSQNEQDNRHYAVAAGLPMLEPADSQEAYDFTLEAIELSERFGTPVILRVTTRICHARTVVRATRTVAAPSAPAFERDIRRYVMMPANARQAHLRMRTRLAALTAWNERCALNQVFLADRSLGIITSGIAFMHVREACPQSSILKLSTTYPLPLTKIREFAASVERCLVVEEGDPYLGDSIRAAGIAVEDKPAMYRFGELSVGRVHRIVGGDQTAEPAPTPGKPPELCAGCPHRSAFEVLKKVDCIVAGDIGCYTLGALPPFEGIDTCVSMGASIGMGLGLRHALGPEQAHRVVSVIGDSTFLHSGTTGLMEMVYNPPSTGHVVVILDNGTTAMTGLQEHPGTGRQLGHQPTGKVAIEEIARATGIAHVHVLDPISEREGFEAKLREALEQGHLAVFVLRHACQLAAGAIKKYERAACTDRSKEDTNPRVGSSAITAPKPDGASLPAEHETGTPNGQAIRGSGTTNIVIAGLGGQGVLRAAQILAQAAFAAGLDVKTSEVHGMSQRGGSVYSDVRFGERVDSPMVPAGEANLFVALSADQIEPHRWLTNEATVFVSPEPIDVNQLASRRSLNIALVGLLSTYLPIDEHFFLDAIGASFAQAQLAPNLDAFALGRRARLAAPAQRGPHHG